MRGHQGVGLFKRFTKIRMVALVEEVCHWGRLRVSKRLVPTWVFFLFLSASSASSLWIEMRALSCSNHKPACCLLPAASCTGLTRDGVRDASTKERNSTPESKANRKGTAVLRKTSYLSLALVPCRQKLWFHLEQ